MKKRKKGRDGGREGGREGEKKEGRKKGREGGNLNTQLTPYRKINLNGTIDLNVRGKTVKLLEDIGENICDLESGKNFLDETEKAQIIKVKY